MTESKTPRPRRTVKPWFAAFAKWTALLGVFVNTALAMIFFGGGHSTTHILLVWIFALLAFISLVCYLVARTWRIGSASSVCAK